MVKLWAIGKIDSPFFVQKIEKTRKKPGQFLYFNDALNSLNFSSEIKALDV